MSWSCASVSNVRQPALRRCGARRRTLSVYKTASTRWIARLRRSGYGAEEDFAFHRSILVATQNSYYGRLFDTFGNAMVPRQWARLDKMTAAERERHTVRMRREHHAIFSAIRDGNEAAARKALRNHLSKQHGALRRAPRRKPAQVIAQAA